MAFDLLSQNCDLLYNKENYSAGFRGANHRCVQPFNVQF